MSILIQIVVIANHLCGIEIFLNSGYVESREINLLKIMDEYNELEEYDDVDENDELDDEIEQNGGSGSGWLWLVIIIALIWFWSSSKKSEPASVDYSTNSFLSEDCSSFEPDNPYDIGSGHYAGYEWAQERDVSSCGGNSQSFIEGCEEYLYQMETYDSCINNE